MATTATELMPAEEFALLPIDGSRYELVRGMVLRMTSGSFLPSNVAMRIGARVVAFSDRHGLGEVTGADGGYVLERGPDTARAPDVGFVRADRVPPAELQDRFAEISPDLAIEVGSPSDRTKDVEEKVEQYLALGVPLVWVFHPRRRTATGRRAGQEPWVLRDGDVVDGEEILLGCRLPVTDVFR